MTIVAIEQHEPEPLLRDDLAGRFLPPGARAIAALARVPFVRHAIRSAAERRAPGSWTGVLDRKRFLDDDLTTAVGDGCESVVIPGAGLDDRAYRLPSLAGVPVYEVDLMPNITAKYQRLHALYGTVPPSVTLAPADLTVQDLGDVLAQHGYRPERPTYFLCEALTQYLAEDEVRRMFRFLAGAPLGSRLGLTYIRRDFIDGRHLRFGLEPETVAEFLAEYGWSVRQDLGGGEFARRYGCPADTGRSRSELERVVTAQRR
ncbi:hypothetical protein BA062_14990 [Prauserella flavalba]|uniref:S-adenosyl-L-methionine-dependent methyltransferase n=2 Tax=Prauserella flavalba TaxID=1477506 RepID=A0A318LR62_9PSEU|nr:hypothetical protein BA062_14990 [Prauserella flavalba]